VTMLQRSPTYVVSPRARRGGGRAAAGAPRARRLRAHPRWKNVALRDGLLPARAALPRGHEEVPRRPGAQGALGPTTTSIAHFTPATSRGTSGCASCPTGTCSQAIREGKASVVTDTIETFTEKGCACSGASSRGHRRDRDGARAAVPRRRALAVDGQRGRSRRRSWLYKGMMLSDVPEPRVRRRLHQRVVDAQVRSWWRVRLPPARPHGPRGRARSSRVATPTPRSRRFLDLSSGYCAAGGRPLPQAGRPRARGGSARNYFADFRLLRLGRVDDPTRSRAHRARHATRARRLLHSHAPRGRERRRAERARRRRLRSTSSLERTA
jgi:monooxygenase